jgi:transcription elongation factor GreA
MHETLITPDGLRRLSAELEELTTTGRSRITDQLRLAIGGGHDLAENGDYQVVRDEQAKLEARIARLERRLASVRLCAPSADGVVDVGERVRVRDLDTGERLELELVGPYEADPLAARVSIESPMGRALLGRRRGEVAVVETPSGTRRLKVVAVDETRVA